MDTNKNLYRFATFAFTHAYIYIIALACECNGRCFSVERKCIIDKTPAEVEALAGSECTDVSLDTPLGKVKGRTCFCADVDGCNEAPALTAQLTTSLLMSLVIHYLIRV